MLDWSSRPAVERSPEEVSGAWVFVGTRVPVKALFENLEDGATIDQFLEWFPGVTREQLSRFWSLRKQVSRPFSTCAFSSIKERQCGEIAVISRFAYTLRDETSAVDRDL